MKKIIFSLVVAFMMIFTANAQIATENAKTFDNTYIGVEVGATTPFNFNSVFPVNPAFGIKFGKEFTPVFGLELEGIATFGDNDYRYGFNGSIPAVGSFNAQKNGSTNTFFKTTNVGLNGVVNLTNLFLGYKGTPRAFELKTNTGIGWLHYFGNYTTTYPIGGYTLFDEPNALTAKTAIDLAFNLGNKKAHTITVSPGIYWNLSEEGPIKFNKNYAQFGLMVGYTYHFKTSNGTHSFKTYDVGAMIGEIDRLNDELAKKPTEVKVIEYVDRVVNNTTNNFNAANVTDTYVFFAFNSAELDDRAKAELDKVGQNGIYDIVAFASNEGTKEYNLALSQKRADAVKAYLENRGCKINSAVGKGVAFGLTTGRVAVVAIMR
jgi:hypothetical protein